MWPKLWTKFIEIAFLLIHLDKTVIMLIGYSAKLRSVTDFNVMISGSVLKWVIATKCRGLLIDEEPSWLYQDESITKSVQAKLRMLPRVRPYVSTDSLLLLYNSILSNLNLITGPKFGWEASEKGC